MNSEQCEVTRTITITTPYLKLVGDEHGRCVIQLGINGMIDVSLYQTIVDAYVAELTGNRPSREVDIIVDSEDYTCEETQG